MSGNALTTATRQAIVPNLAHLKDPLMSHGTAFAAHPDSEPGTPTAHLVHPKHYGGHPAHQAPGRALRDPPSAEDIDKQIRTFFERVV
jgi:hypothetical protein